MDKDSRNRPAESLGVFDETWFDPIEIGARDRIRGFIEELVEAELNEVLGRTRYQRPAGNPGTEAAQETSRISTRSAGTSAARLVRAGDDQRAASASEQHRWNEPGMAQQRAAALCTDD